MIRMYIALMFLIPLLDAFDRWFERTAMHSREGQVIPDKWIGWGIDVDTRRRWLLIRLPFVRTWGPLDYGMSQGWIDHRLWWIEGSGPRIVPPL